MQKKIFNPFPDGVRKIGVVSPSKMPDEELLVRSLDLIRSFGVEVALGPHALTAGDELYFAADDVARADDFNAMLRDPSVELILCTKGGYGAMYLLEKIDWDLLRKRNLPVCGFSDITALHLAMLTKKAGVPVEAQMAARMSISAEDELSMVTMKRSLTLALGGTVPPEIARLTPVSSVQKDITAPLIPVNLTMLFSLTGTPWVPDLSGCILAVEDICEEAYRIDRMLLNLDLCGIFDRVAAVIFSKFEPECGTPEEMERIFRRFAARHPETPFFKGLTFGHTLPSISFVCGRNVTLKHGGELIY